MAPIRPLYRGLLHDYLRCTQCNYSRIRSDAFMDIPLVIRGVSSLEEALDLYAHSLFQAPVFGDGLGAH